MRRLLLSGDRANFTTLEFDTASNELRILADYTAPCNASWTERSCSQGSVDHVIGISEDEESALLYTFRIDHAQQSCEITSQQQTSAGPCHCKFLLRCSCILYSIFWFSPRATRRFCTGSGHCKCIEMIAIIAHVNSMSEAPSYFIPSKSANTVRFYLRIAPKLKYYPSSATKTLDMAQMRVDRRNVAYTKY
jgi:hypothetical protein